MACMDHNSTVKNNVIKTKYIIIIIMVHSSVFAMPFATEAALDRTGLDLASQVFKFRAI